MVGQGAQTMKHTCVLANMHSELVSKHSKQQASSKHSRQQAQHRMFPWAGKLHTVCIRWGSCVCRSSRPCHPKHCQPVEGEYACLLDAAVLPLPTPLRMPYTIAPETTDLYQNTHSVSFHQPSTSPPPNPKSPCLFSPAGMAVPVRPGTPCCPPQTATSCSTAWQQHPARLAGHHPAPVVVKGGGDSLCLGCGGV